MTRFIGVVSGKGGVGKTTTAINLGTALTGLGKDVLLLDGNLTAPNIGVYLGFPDPPVSLHDVLEEKKDPNEAIYMHASGLKVVPGSIRMDSFEKLDLNKLRKMFRKFQGTSETAIVDIGSAMTKETLSVMGMVDEVLIVTNPELAAVTDALKTIKKAEEENKLVLGVVLNRVKPEGNELSMENVAAMLEKPIIATIPECISVKQAQAMKHPVVYVEPDSIVSSEFKKLAERLK